ncbi:MAG TPA: phasin family protein [Solimonas sp.]|nr:phasin family protein [Solimonas sp.]
MNDVKGRVEPIVAKGQEVVLASFETLKAANGIVVEGVTTLVQTQVEAGKDLFELAQTSFEKARADGLKAVAADPIAYLPDSKERVISAYNDSVAVFTKTGDELFKTFKQGYAKIAAEAAPTVAKAKKTVKKTASKARKTIKAAA